MIEDLEVRVVTVKNVVNTLVSVMGYFAFYWYSLTILWDKPPEIL
jgi:hypothetical protein